MTIENKLDTEFYTKEIENTEYEKLKVEIDKEIRKLIDILLNNQENFIGKGQNAEVHCLPDNKNVCFKITTHREAYGKNLPKPRIPITKQNGTSKISHEPKKEGAYMSELLSIDSVVRVPRPLEWAVWELTDDGEGYFVKEKIEILAMERMHAVSIQDVLSGIRSIPENFNLVIFFKELRNFVEKMHLKNIFHHDLHSGNIMIDLETGLPYVIDFGHSGSDEHDDSFFEMRVGDKISKFKYKKDMEWVDLLENELSKYLTKSV